MREGNREYFYSKLDEHFPGMKDRYIKTFGDKYECSSPNSRKLREIFRRECDRNGILYGMNNVFEYTNNFDERTKQTSLF